MDRFIGSLEADLDLSVLNAMQDHVAPPYRHHWAGIIAEVINKRVAPLSSNDPVAEQHAARLHAEGYSRLGQVLSPAQLAEIHEHFRTKPCYNGHVRSSSDRTLRTLEETAERFHYGCYSLADIATAPHLLELANHPQLLGIAERYLGCTPTLYSINAWWSFAGHGRAHLSQEFHRDQDDFKFCTLFVFLTDVGLANGAHSFIRQSHRVDLADQILRQAAPRFAARGRQLALPDLYGDSAGYGQDPLYQDVFQGLIDTITGPAGFGFIADTGGLHKGEILTEGRRLMFWARYGLYRNSGNTGDETVPIEPSLIAGRLPTDERTAYINRCLIRTP
jgi:Phytanoyl-CoA dioxygenase (PhyH)